MKNIKTSVKEIFTESVSADIANIICETYRKINKKEVRDELFLDNSGIAITASNSNWACIQQYAKEKKLGEIKKTSNNKRRWFVKDLVFTINKVDEKLRPSKPYTDDSCQIKLSLGDVFLDVTTDMPLVIGYVPSTNRDLITSIHIIKYKNDGSLEWKIPIYNHQYVSVEIPVEQPKRDVRARIKIKTPDKKVVDSFDRN